MSRIRKQVLASRANEAADSFPVGLAPRIGGPFDKSGTLGGGQRGLAVKAKGGVGSLAETRRMEAETLDLERSLDTLRMQMQLEKERHGALV